MKEIGIDNMCSGIGWDTYMKQMEAQDERDRQTEDIIDKLCAGETVSIEGASWRLVDCIPENEDGVQKALVALINRPGAHNDKELYDLISALSGSCARVADTILWHRNEPQCYIANTQTEDILSGECVAKRDAPAMWKANGRLIAAAPDLLSAVQRLLDLYCNDGIEYTGNHPAAEARKAIAKAIGEEE